MPMLKNGRLNSFHCSNQVRSSTSGFQTIPWARSSGFKQSSVKPVLNLDAVQNHLSLLDRSSEQAGILDYCKENNIAFWAYMILEQGALTGKYDVDRPFPAGSARAQIYNAKLPELTELINTLKEVGAAHDLTVAQTAMSWAVTKGALPIVGVTSAKHVDDAAKVSASQLTDEEMVRLEKVADKAGVNTIGSWEPDMRE